DLVGDAVVLADEQGVDGGQLDVLVGADVAGHEELVVGDAVGVVGDLEGGGVVGVAVLVDAGEVGLVVQRQQVVLGADDAGGGGAGLEAAALVGAQGGGDHRVGAVDHRGVDEGGDVVDLLPRVAGAGARGRVELGAAEGDDHLAGEAGVEGVAGRHGD